MVENLPTSTLSCAINDLQFDIGENLLLYYVMTTKIVFIPINRSALFLTIYARNQGTTTSNPWRVRCLAREIIAYNQIILLVCIILLLTAIIFT